MEINQIKFFSWAFIILSIFLLALKIILDEYWVFKISKRVATTGVIIGFGGKQSIENNFHIFLPIFEYEVEGKKYTYHSEDGTSDVAENKIGDLRNLYYNPKNIEDVIWDRGNSISDHRALYVLAIIFFLIGAISLIYMKR